MILKNDKESEARNLDEKTCDTSITDDIYTTQTPMTPLEASDYNGSAFQQSETTEPSFNSKDIPYLKVNSNSFSKWSDGISVSEHKQQQIIDNFIDAMEFQQIGVVFE